jgi:hypothetical protein
MFCYDLFFAHVDIAQSLASREEVGSTRLNSGIQVAVADVLVVVTVAQ